MKNIYQLLILGVLAALSLSMWPQAGTAKNIAAQQAHEVGVLAWLK